MARDTSAAAGKNAQTGQNLSSTYTGTAAGTRSILTPTLNRMATAPQGFSPTTINNMNTAALQTLGGAEAGTVGGGIQRAAATNNAGGYAPAAADASRAAMQGLSDAALGVQNKNAMLQEQQRAQGLSGLENLYGEDVGAGENALGLSNQSLNTQTNARQSGWLQNTLGILNTLKPSTY